MSQTGLYDSHVRAHFHVQASPATYEIQQDGSQYFIAPASKRLYVDYDPAKDVLNISSLGHYLRN